MRSYDPTLTGYSLTYQKSAVGKPAIFFQNNEWILLRFNRPLGLSGIRCSSPMPAFPVRQSDRRSQACSRTLKKNSIASLSLAISGVLRILYAMHLGGHQERISSRNRPEQLPDNNTSASPREDKISSTCVDKLNR